MSRRFGAGQSTMAGFYQRGERIVIVIADGVSENILYLVTRRVGIESGDRLGPVRKQNGLAFSCRGKDSCRPAESTTQA